jgi:hypothetical protein
MKQSYEADSQGEPTVIRELDEVVLTCDLPKQKLAAGDIGTVVLVHGEGRGYEVEFMTLDGETIAVSTLRADQVRQAHADEIAHARPIAS